MRFWKELKHRPFCNDAHFILFAVILLLVSLKYPIIFVFLFLYLVFIYKKTSYLLPIVIILVIIGIIYYIYINISYELSSANYDAYIYDKYEDYYIIKINNINVKAYSKDMSYLPGDKINIDLKLYPILDKSYEEAFDYKSYLASNHIYFQGYISNIELLDTGISINRIKIVYLEYLRSHLSADSYNYVKAMVFARNDLSTDLKEGYQALGLAHILAISGMHIVFLYKALEFVNTRLLKLYRPVLPVLIIGVYGVFLGFPSSVLRAYLFILIGVLNNRGKTKYTKLDIYSFSFVIMAIINPLKCYQTGFILSFLVSFILLFTSEIITVKSKLLNLYLTTLLIYFFTLPFVISYSNKISLFAIIFSPILGNVISLILLPVSYTCAIFPILDSVLKYIFILISGLVTNVSKFNITINVPTFKFYMYIIYYILYTFILISIIKKKRVFQSVISFVIFFIAILSIRFINPFYKITFASVGQGDCEIIEFPNNKGIIVIDAYNSLSYLESLGIKTIDYLIITHSDSDHIGDSEKIINKFNVKNVLYPKYDTLCLESFNNHKAIGVDYKDSFMFNGVLFDIIAPITKANDVNSNSLVLRFKIEEYSFLFCGDMTIEEENTLLNNNTFIKSTFIKVGHHGSNTSTGIDFLNKVNPDYSIISVGKDNSYGHPNSSVVKRLEKTSKVYRTDLLGNIDVYIGLNNMWIKSYR